MAFEARGKPGILLSYLSFGKYRVKLVDDGIVETTRHCLLRIDQLFMRK